MSYGLSPTNQSSSAIFRKALATYLIYIALPKVPHEMLWLLVWASLALYSQKFFKVLINKIYLTCEGIDRRFNCIFQCNTFYISAIPIIKYRMNNFHFT